MSFYILSTGIQAESANGSNYEPDNLVKSKCVVRHRRVFYYRILDAVSMLKEHRNEKSNYVNFKVDQSTMCRLSKYKVQFIVVNYLEFLFVDKGQDATGSKFISR